jgi:GT2 family glycosyltransferase
VTTPQGGRVVLDGTMLEMWKYANGRPRQEILAYFKENGFQPGDVSAALVCLTGAGLLSFPQDTREEQTALSPRQPGSLVSALIVSYNSLAWLPGCLDSLSAQTHSPLEIIVVDNGSSDGSADWLAEHHPDVILVRLEKTCSLAAAINQGVKVSHGDYLLLLNPDVVLDSQAVSHLVRGAQSDEKVAAVAAKLYLMWAPAFLNGLGNLVGALSWGTDIALGHLDLGQFDHWTELPSACFAAALLPVTALKSIGPLDDGLPMYYEDSEWCYRARLLGYTVRPAPQALVYHAFSSQVPGGTGGGLAVDKLERVIYGRLRFITRLLGPGYLLRFLIGYLFEDLLNAAMCLLRGRWGHLRAYWRAWSDYFGSLKELRSDRRALQSRRTQKDRSLFFLQRHTPVPLVWHGIPLLTWDIVSHEYKPWIERRQTARPKMSLQRALSIWRAEGAAALAHRLGRGIIWKWMQP